MFISVREIKYEVKSSCVSFGDSPTVSSCVVILMYNFLNLLDGSIRSRHYRRLSWTVCLSVCCVFHCSNLEKIIVTGYKALQLIYFFTVGPDEVKAWTVQVCSFVAISM